MNKAKYKAKFADKLMEELVMISKVLTTGYSIIDEICNDYDSRTCGNCKWFDKWEQCSNEDSPCNHVNFSMDKDFGCNKFERIQDGL